jgi:hypothetical protein
VSTVWDGRAPLGAATARPTVAGASMTTRTGTGARIREALEAYLTDAEGTGELALSHAFLAGLRVGLDLGTRPSQPHHASNLSTPRNVYTLPPGANRVPPLRPPSTTRPREKISDPESGSGPLPLVDTGTRSIERANAGAETLELFPVPAPSAPPRRKTRCPLPHDFALTEELRRFAEAGALDPAQELAAMKDHFRASGELRADWPATFREWCRRSLVFRERRARR